MHLQAITIRNWKVYRNAHFEFPAPGRGQNIVLIGALNGYGKTSFFESVILGLFGKKGLPLLGRTSYSDGANAGQAQHTYAQFMEDALHRGVRGNGRATCSVEMVFADSAGEKIELKRTWRFSAGGSFIARDEEISIYEGPNRSPVGPESGVIGTDRDDWFHNHIINRFLPYSLVQFFLFDGEQASAMAERDMTDQVRMGIDGLFGLPILHILAEDLRKYAHEKKRQNPQADDDTAKKLEHDLKVFTDKRDEAAGKLAEISPQLETIKQEQERLIREIGSHDGQSQLDAKEYLDNLAKYRHTKEQAEDELQKMLEGGIALALVGGDLRNVLSVRLHSETVRTDWEAGQQHGEKNLDRFTASLKEKLAIIPGSEHVNLDDVIRCVREAWADLWHPPPANCAENYRHTYLNGAGRTSVIAKLASLGDVSASAVTTVLDTIAENETKMRSIQEAMNRARSAARPDVQQKAERIQNLTKEIAEKSQYEGALKREIDVRNAEIGVKNQDIARQASLRDQAKPANRRLTRALNVANVIDDISKEATPLQIHAIEDAMTVAFKEMAHKKLVSEIRISDKCDVALLTSQKEVIEKRSLSAGEKQIFTQALIAAVVSVSEHSFPMIIDTPLGRLDKDHRKEVLRHLAKRGNQVILLSTNTEVVGEYLGAIDPHVQKKYQLHCAQNGDVGESCPAEGYFQSTESQSS